MAGYHKRVIKKGTVGDVSKIREEMDELEDSIEQGVQVMALVELSDIIGAIKHYLKQHHPSITLQDLEKMADITIHAFETGQRK